MKMLPTGFLLALAWTVNASAQDPAALPDYRPAQQVSGLLRSRGNDQMTALM